MNENHLLLNKLKDIHIPNSYSPWPLARGWYLVILFAIFCLALAGYFYLKHKKKERLKTLFLAEMNVKNEAELLKADTAKFASLISLFFKRFMLWKNQNIKNYYGKKWVGFILEKLKLNNISDAAISILTNANYTNKKFIDTKVNQELYKIFKKFLRKV